MTTRAASTDHPIHDLLASRWSPYGFADRDVDAADLRSLFEAARWAPSSYNEQPWRYIVATRAEPELHARVLGCLVEANQAWAKAAPVLVLTVVSTHFARNGKPNAAAEHDIGLASMALTVEATARGLMVHQMIGLDPEHARAELGVPEGHRVLTAMAIGHLAEPDTLPEELRKRDTGMRQRRPLAETVFGAAWGEPSSIL